MVENLTFKELVELVNKICNPKLNDEEVSEYIEKPMFLTQPLVT
jgi:hypothetical protein